MRAEEEERSEFFFTKRELIYLNNKSVKTGYARLSYCKKVYLECFIFQHFSSSRGRVCVCARVSFALCIFCIEDRPRITYGILINLINRYTLRSLEYNRR